MSTKHMLITPCGELPHKNQPNLAAGLFDFTCVFLKCEPIILSLNDALHVVLIYFLSLMFLLNLAGCTS